MAIGFSGIGAGADWNSIINQLLQIESRPLDQLRSREREIEQQISDFGQVKSAIDSFRSSIEGLTSSSGFAEFSGTSSDETVLSITADSTAAASSYDVVVTQLASRDNLCGQLYSSWLRIAVDHSRRGHHESHGGRQQQHPCRFERRRQ
ncbi:MAG: hypothetical protein KZQ78_17750 [Candidatus Thiodiazotropha sp. (ex Ustalcina ferruginea)]|nr:hypothetical protein [Candidatus Thiodiazotropha sp. (ex Ustalcina ferruginea)]